MYYRYHVTYLKRMILLFFVINELKNIPNIKQNHIKALHLPISNTICKLMQLSISLQNTKHSKQT